MYWTYKPTFRYEFKLKLILLVDIKYVLPKICGFKTIDKFIFFLVVEPTGYYVPYKSLKCI